MQDIETDCNWTKGAEAKGCSKSIQELGELLSILENQVAQGDIDHAKYERYLGTNGLISHYLRYACGQNPYHEEGGNWLFRVRGAVSIPVVWGGGWSIRRRD